MNVKAELKASIGMGSFVGAATIVAEENFDEKSKFRLIRRYALLAIAAGKYEQARHLVVIRYPHLMTARVRWNFWKTIWF